MSEIEKDELALELVEMERKRMGRLIGLTAVVVVLIVGTLFWAVERGGDLFRPNLDVEGGEAALFLETNDPICRGIIDDVREAGQDWKEREERFEAGLLSEDLEEVDQLKETARAFRSRMEAIAARVGDAVLRERSSPGQMRKWFSSQDHEFGLIEELAERRLQELRGDEVEELGGLWERPEELRDRVLMTIDENYQEFRVWVAAGGHPCGAARE